MMLILFMLSWHFPTIFGSDHDIKKEETFALISCHEGVLAHGDTSLLSQRWPWERNVLGVYEE